MQVFTTGAFLESQKIGDKWYWVVSMFEDETYMDGKRVSTKIYADTEEELLLEEEKEELDGFTLYCNNRELVV